MTKKELLSIKKWYHATSLEGYKGILGGIRADFNKGVPRDFGYGFYLNRSVNWSNNYILNTVCLGNEDLAKDYVILEINFDLEDVVRKFGDNKERKVFRFFKGQNGRYAEFVIQNRVNYAFFDYEWHIVAGPMLSNEQIAFIEEHRKESDIYMSEMISVLQGNEKEVQLLLHSQEVCDMIKAENIADVLPWRRC